MLLHNKRNFTTFLFLCILTSGFVFGQEEKIEIQPNKGKFFVFWGWNRGFFSNSDIHFKGDNYDFTLSDVTANDKVTPFSFNDYFNPTRITIPQTNYQIGYFFKEHYTVSIGVDHMKYVMNQNQSVKINGEINTGSSFDGSYANDNIVLEQDFLEFEHTDGLNYINSEVKRFDNISSFLGIKTPNFRVNLTEGVGVGLLFPRTNTRLLGQERYDEFHVSGWGVSASAGINLTFFKYFFLQSDFKVGYIDMSDIRTTMSASDSAAQHFTFFERTLVFGTRFSIFNKK